MADAVRAFGVVFGAPAALCALFLWSACSVPRSLRRGRPPAAPALLTTLGGLVYAAGIVPWMRHWGASTVERVAHLPGDEIVPDPAFVSTRAVTIQAPVSEVWPWLAQIGQERGGFYSYEWLENLAGCRMRNADRIHPEWQQREAGETVMLHPANGLPVSLFEPGRAFGIEGWGVYALEPCQGGRATRLLTRSRIPRGAGALFYVLLVELPHFVMERRMLLGIKERAERASLSSET